MDHAQTHQISIDKHRSYQSSNVSIFYTDIYRFNKIHEITHNRWDNKNKLIKTNTTNCTRSIRYRFRCRYIISYVKVVVQSQCMTAKVIDVLKIYVERIYSVFDIHLTSRIVRYALPARSALSLESAKRTEFQFSASSHFGVNCLSWECAECALCASARSLRVYFVDSNLNMNNKHKISLFADESIYKNKTKRFPIKYKCFSIFSRQSSKEIKTNAKNGTKHTHTLTTFVSAHTRERVNRLLHMHSSIATGKRQKHRP